MDGWTTIWAGERLAPKAVAKGGLAVCTFDAVDGAQLWEVHRLLLRLTDAGGSPASVGSSAFIFFDSTVGANQRDATPSGRADFNVWEAAGSPLVVPSSRQLLVEWTGPIPDGYQAAAVAQVAILARDANAAPAPFLGVR